MTELTEFLTARLDEREALAKTAHPGRWRPTHRRKDHGDGSHSEAYGIDSDTAVSMPLTTRGEMWDVETVVWIAEDRDYGYPEPGIDRLENAAFIAGNDPAYVLADIAADRKLIAEYEEAKFHYEAEHDIDGTAKYSDGAVWEFLADLEVWESGSLVIGITGRSGGREQLPASGPHHRRRAPSPGYRGSRHGGRRAAA